MSSSWLVLPSIFKDQVINLVKEMMWGFWNDFDVDQLLDDAPKYCPHHPEYNPEAKASTYSWPSVDSVSNISVETIVAIGLIALQSSLIVSAKNQLLLPGNTDGLRGQTCQGKYQAECAGDHSNEHSPPRFCS
jgi:hypothetical protein